MVYKLIFSLSHKNRMRLIALIAYMIICSPMLFVVGVLMYFWNL
jgi:hypothetical protein